MAKKTSKAQRTSYLIALGMLAFGIFLCAKPGELLHTACVVFGIFLLVYSVMHFIMYFFGDRADPFQRFDLVIGIVTLAGGLFVLIKRDFVIAILPILLGIFVLVSSLSTLQTSFDLKRNAYPRWWTVSLMGLLTALLGAILLFDPFGSAIASTIFIGITFIVNAVIQLWQTICVHKNADDSTIEIDSIERR